MGRSTDQDTSHAVKKSVEGKSDSSKKAGHCAEEDMKTYVNVEIRSLKVLDEVENVCD